MANLGQKWKYSPEIGAAPSKLTRYAGCVIRAQTLTADRPAQGPVHNSPPSERTAKYSMHNLPPVQNSGSAFIVFGAERTGTTVIGNSLATHPEILYYGELFHTALLRRSEEASRKTLGHGIVKNLTAGIPVCKDEDDGFQYLQSILERCAVRRVTGFKMLYHHAHSGNVARAWQYIAHNSHIKLIHVRRRNLLESLLSRERAEVSGIWHSPQPVVTTPLTLAPAQCLAYFIRYEEMFENFQPLLDSHPVLEVWYDELLADFSGLINRILLFLGVDAVSDCYPLIKKIASRPIEADVTNYRQLRLLFSHTPYARYFRDTKF
jgi:LPS sulfotransferase NodH